MFQWIKNVNWYMWAVGLLYAGGAIQYFRTGRIKLGIIIALYSVSAFVFGVL